MDVISIHPQLTKEPPTKETVLGKRQKRKVKIFGRNRMDEIQCAAESATGKIEMIRKLITLGLWVVQDVLMAELNELTGPRHKHDEKMTRWETFYILIFFCGLVKVV